jgi:hypothetical protein
VIFSSRKPQSGNPERLFMVIAPVALKPRLSERMNCNFSTRQMKHSATELALRFALALDREDYNVVRALLAPDCRYEARGAPISGADAIVDSYRCAGRTARLLFDTVDYESGLISAQANVAEISFSDRLTKDGKQHLYSCRQRLFFTPGGLVSRIVHEELPGEHEGLLEFCHASGVILPDSRQ